MQIKRIQNGNPIIYKARFVTNLHYNKACKEASFYNAKSEIKKGEELLSIFPNHELELKPDGIRNVTTNKYYDFPVIVEDESPFENLIYFYDMLKDKKNKFIEKLFSR